MRSNGNQDLLGSGLVVNILESFLDLTRRTVRRCAMYVYWPCARKRPGEGEKRVHEWVSTANQSIMMETITASRTRRDQ